MQLVGAGRVDPEQLALCDRDQIMALISLLRRQVLESLRSCNRCVEPRDLSLDARFGEVRDLTVELMTTLPDGEPGAGAEAFLDEVVHERRPTRGSGRRRSGLAGLSGNARSRCGEHKRQGRSNQVYAHDVTPPSGTVVGKARYCSRQYGAGAAGQTSPESVDMAA